MGQLSWDISHENLSQSNGTAQVWDSSDADIIYFIFYKIDSELDMIIKIEVLRIFLHDLKQTYRSNLIYSTLFLVSFI